MSSVNDELKAALKLLTISQARVKTVADYALKNSQQFKRIVFEIENHTWRSEKDKRLAGIYVIDAIVRGVRLRLGVEPPPSCENLV